MSQPQKERKIERSLFSIGNYIIFFLLISFVVTCSFFIFFEGLNVPREALHKNALLTFFNIAVLSLICCLVDGVRRKYTIEQPIKRILAATHQVTQGDFSVRIQPFNHKTGKNELDIIIEDFNKMVSELASNELLKNDFIANVSHELKTPLAVINNYAKILQQPELSETERISCGHALAQATKKQADLITNILKLNKLDNQQIFPQPSAYNLGEQLRQNIIGFEELWEAKGLKIEIDIQEDVVIEADSELLSLVWNNLLSNAIKFTEPDGNVTISLKEEAQEVVVTVRDTGCGMTATEGERIFEKFYQGDSARATQGNGLGLALVKRVVDIVNGEISVESTINSGTTFSVRLLKREDEQG